MILKAIICFCLAIAASSLPAQLHGPEMDPPPGEGVKPGITTIPSPDLQEEEGDPDLREGRSEYESNPVRERMEDEDVLERQREESPHSIKADDWKETTEKE